MRRTLLPLPRLSIYLAAFIVLANGITAKGQGSSGSASQSLDFAVYCTDQFAVIANQTGISGIHLKTNHIAWSALPDKAVDLGPVAARDSVAVITDGFYSIYAFSKATGKPLWHKEQHSSVLVSDGPYFYVARPDNDGVTALDSRTGTTVWTLRIPERGGASFLRIHDGLLYSNSFVVDLTSRKLVHKWAGDTAVTAIAFPKHTETLLGDSEGDLTLYDSAFKVTNKLHAGDASISSIAASEEGILVSLAARDRSHAGAIEFLTWKGEQKWLAPGLPIDFMIFNPFVIAGNAALITVPDSESSKIWRLESRDLVSGKINWTAPQGDYYAGWPVVCGNKVFIRDNDHISYFNVADGAPRLSE